MPYGERIFDLPNYGCLYLSKTYYRMGSDEILFTCVDRAGNTYLCSCAKLGEIWAVAQVTPAGIELMESKTKTIREVFELAAGRKLTVRWDGTSYHVRQGFGPRTLPRRGAYL